jgi:hypothetical protein
MKKNVILSVGYLLTSLAGIALASDPAVYTLYRNSLTDRTMRLHVATFDTADGEAYNRANCELAATLFQQQPGVKTKFWCEIGRFKK